MPLQHFQYDNFRTPEAVVDMINEVIDYVNALEARLAVLEHPVERLSEETRPTGCWQEFSLSEQKTILEESAKQGAEDQDKLIKAKD